MDALKPLDWFREAAETGNPPANLVGEEAVKLLAHNAPHAEEAARIAANLLTED